MAIVTVEVLDQVVIPMVCLKMGIPPVTNAVGLGEAVYPILLPKLGGKEAIEFVEKYKEVSGNEEFYDDLN